ncbi:TRAF-type zinc finger domain-containing protein 1-like [Bicyclus anynana]|uniref:TRAF-type zinc finger domain-containing protein 1-like n=1 Tax=Bicyclus anynana TaxID=110368 RepID=A0ABM3LIJ5_BICAN|nr:TRAF-type zinc finger domain-containing protein 1-like [Bicyclus anynana]
MDESETKTCENCKRDIPCVNFTTHAVHCARNLSVCPACKEPVPHAELPAHHDKMHKLPHARNLSVCPACKEPVPHAELPAHHDKMHKLRECPLALCMIRFSTRAQPQRVPRVQGARAARRAARPPRQDAQAA